MDAQFFYAGLLAVDGDLPRADGGMGGAVFAGEAATDGGVAGFEAGVVFYVCEGEAVGGELVVLFGGGGGDGAALYVDVGTALADFLVYLVLWADDAQFAADVGIDAVGIGLGADQGGVAFAG